MQSRLYLKVAEQILAYIAEKNLPAGAFLPNERKFAEMLAVSRSTVREAEVALESAGWITINRGRGRTVAATFRPEIDPLKDLDELELLEARSVVESGAAALAAHNITQEQLATLAELMEYATGADWEHARHSQQVFYQTLAAATGNVALTRSIDHLIHAYFKAASLVPDHDGQVAYLQLVKRGFSDVISTMTDHDPAGARKAMRSHFYDILTFRLDCMEREALAATRAASARERERFLMQH